jgi:hypothetical protein
MAKQKTLYKIEKKNIIHSQALALGSPPWPAKFFFKKK